ncbi:MAG: hypothetical protein EAS48_07005 [Chryseobacterium sp.]|nr:MAG: hypothetical protein EAS48_07005 [Chryseobacterium sp.]
MKVLSFFKKSAFYYGIVRYLLAFGMIPYGITKIFRTQFVVLPFDSWTLPLERIDGKSLAWAFLGYSGWFQILLGFLELIPSLMLLFRRTSFLGAVLLLPMTLNVFLINFALDLWIETQWLGAIFLALNTILLIFNRRRLLQIWRLLIPARTQTAKKWEWLGNAAFLVLVYFMSVPMLLDYRNQRSALTGDFIGAMPNESILDKETINGVVQPAQDYKCYFGAYGHFTQIAQDSSKHRKEYFYEQDRKNNMLILKESKGQKGEKYNFLMHGDSAFTLAQRSGNNEVIRHFKRRRIKSAQ